jgi:hypothetical protein
VAAGLHSREVPDLPPCYIVINPQCPFGFYGEHELDQSAYDLICHGTVVRILISGACLACEDMSRRDVFQEVYQRYNAQGLIYRHSYHGSPPLNHNLNGPQYARSHIHALPHQVDQTIDHSVPTPLLIALTLIQGPGLYQTRGQETRSA